MPEAGVRLGPYELLAPLGAGGMGEVYRAKDSKLGREVAVKVLPESFSADPDRLRRFEQEAKALAALNHPNVLTIYELGSHGGAPFLVMELLEGETLRDGLSTGPLPVAKALEVAIQVARGLSAAHGKGIVHRDLKPENVFLTGDGVKILDFGLAKQGQTVFHSTQSELATQDFRNGTVEGSFLGTVGYMSPEQVRGEPVDARSDLFGLGLLLYEMLTGRQAFKGATTPDTLSAILTSDPPDLERLGRESGVGLARVLVRCLAKRREDRFSSAQDLAFALQALAFPSSPGPEPEGAEKSIVVLPFENLSPDPDNAYFADGLTEELIADLSKVRALRVISRTSAMHFKGTTRPLPEVAQALKVRFVLEGSVRKAGNSLRITAQLIEAATDTHLWAEKYAGTFDDVFDLQEKISRAIVEALEVTLTPQEDRKLAARPLPNPAAYDAYLRAYRDIMNWDPEALKRADRLLENARTIVGEHPQILAGQAMVAFQRVNMGLAQEDVLAHSRALASRALALDPDLPQGHTALAMIAMLDGNFPEGILHLRRARREAPGDVTAWGWLPWYLCCVGQLQAAAKLTEEVLRLDPVDPNWHMMRAAILVFAGDFARGQQQMAVTLALAPNTSMIQFWHAHTLALAGRLDEALRALETISPDPETDLWARGIHLLRATLTHDGEGFDTLLTVGAQDSIRRDNQFSYHLSQYLAALGRVDDAFLWLAHAVDLTFVPVSMFDQDPFLAPLRADPRWVPIMDKARATQASVPEEA